MNNKINPVLYNMYLRINDTMSAVIVHRRKRQSPNCIEIIFYNDLCKFLRGRINTLKEAEACGYWVVCRPQTKRGHTVYKNHRVYQLFLTPVHPKKRREALIAARQATPQDVTFEPIITVKPRLIPKNSPMHAQNCQTPTTRYRPVNPYYSYPTLGALPVG